MSPTKDPDAPEDPAAALETEEQRQQSLARVENGGIPLAAELRLRELSRGAGAFTSDLSVGSFALSHELGLRPLAQVMGSSIYQVGYQATMPSGLEGGFMYELEALSEAWNEVRDRAFARLAQEAEVVGADAVVGVQISSGAREFTAGAIECIVIGTAVRTDGKPTAGAPGAGAKRPAPVLTELSVPDFWKLRRAGIGTLGVVAWTSVFFVQAWAAAQLGGMMGFSQNQELGEYTQGFYAARETVMERLGSQARALGATGVVGVRVDHTARPTEGGGGPYQRRGLIVSFSAIGTAISEHGEGAPPVPMTTLDMTEGAS
ncbi:MAG: heavy metal-binding domain-containing protein [Solirubrobacteraceae bacterium]